MSTLTNAPLVEAVFELKWGEKSAGTFEYSQEEQQLFPGKVSVVAIKEGYPLVTSLSKNNSVLVPQSPSHRFLIAEKTWPCFQLGIGVFTVNQINEGYDWETFKGTINQGLGILNEADPTKFSSIINTAHVVLNYQDAFYPNDTETIENYLEEHFKVKTKLPELFLENENIADNINTINVSFNIRSIRPEGIIKIFISNALIEGTPGLILRTSVESKLAHILKDDDFINSIMSWSEEAHDIQRHSFKTLINPSAYTSEK